jgi:4-amino-4-deoxy-L-arabinose transferase-like glycosyltransferase
LNTKDSSFTHKLIVKRKPSRGLVFMIVLVLALAIRLGVWVTHLDRPDTFVQPDTLSYLEPGMQLLLDGSFPSFSRTPIYPLFLAILSKILSPNPALLALVQIAISLVTMGLIYNLCSGLFSFRTTLLILILMALDLTSAISANHLLPETLFTFLLFACLVGLLHFNKRDRSDRSSLIGYSLFGFSFSVLSLCRPIAFVLFAVVAFWLYLTLRKRRPHILPLLLCFCACSMLLSLSWVIRNHAHTGTYFFSTITSTNLYEYRAAWNVSRTSNRSFAATQDEFKQRAFLKKKNANLNEGELARWKQAEGIEILMDNPLLTLYQGFDGLIKMYLGISTADINGFSGTRRQNDLKNSGSLIIELLPELIGKDVQLRIAGIKLWAILYLVIVYLGVALAVMEIVMCRFSLEQRSALWLMLIVIAYFTFFSVGAETYSRFRVPVAPALSVLGAVGWASFLNRIRRHMPRPEGNSLDNKGLI